MKIIEASVSRRSNGWAAVLEYPNGGRQMFYSRFGTMEEAQEEANNLLRVRLAYPQGVIADPASNQLQDLSAALYARGNIIEAHRVIRFPSLL